MTAAEAPAGRQLVYTLAITEGVRMALAEDPLAFMAGEDVAGAGSVFGIYRGLLDEFGPERVIDTPISESGIIGMAVGAVQTAMPGVYIAMSGQVFPAGEVRKNRAENRFEKL